MPYKAGSAGGFYLIILQLGTVKYEVIQRHIKEFPSSTINKYKVRIRSQSQFALAKLMLRSHVASLRARDKIREISERGILSILRAPPFMTAHNSAERDSHKILDSFIPIRTRSFNTHLEGIFKCKFVAADSIVAVVLFFNKIREDISSHQRHVLQ